MLLGIGDVAGTNILGEPLPGALEITSSTMVLIVFGGLCYSQIQRGHIRVELVYTHVGPRVQALMDVVTHLSALVFFSLILWQGVSEALFSWRISEASVGLIRVPLWPARFVLVLGAGLLLVQLVFDLFTDIDRLVRGALGTTAGSADKSESE